MTKRTIMTAADAQVAFGQLRDRIGGKADLYVSLNGPAGKMPLTCTIWPAGMASRDDRRVRAEGVSWEDLLAKTEAAWEEQNAAWRADLVSKMALAIIRLTDSVGECSEAMLRLEFDHGHVTAWGAEAVERANEMAGRGPFAIKATLGANRPLEAA